MRKNGSQEGESPSQRIDAGIQELGDWRGEMLGRYRALIQGADPEVVEEWKWRGVPVWSHDGTKKLPAHHAIAEAEGGGAVQVWIDHLPGRQTAHARRVDAVVTRQLPNAHQAVKWHGVWYGVPGV